MPNADIATERVDRFEMLRQSMTEEERVKLDKYVAFVTVTIRKRGHQFGTKMAKELIIALVDFKAGLPGTAAPRKGEPWNTKKN